MFKFEHLKETIAVFISNAISDHETSLEIKHTIKHNFRLKLGIWAWNYAYAYKKRVYWLKILCVIQRTSCSSTTYWPKYMNVISEGESATVVADENYLVRWLFVPLLAWTLSRSRKLVCSSCWSKKRKKNWLTSRAM